MDAAEIKRLIEQALPAADVAVESPDNTHFTAVIVAPDFEGKSRIARHQLVYGALGGRVGGEIHALSMQTLTPEEYRDLG
ncbi:MAG TPA: BolA/IbaG family iron-sulfur metabolism protein [Gammaproteobacteria bacterium]|jgi:acid stress-induced BolA-like protein IbaG/YrbA|nr:BolA/IbaG family iron-sulfur metabolism protein [Gammaproteobacteria bacterium]